MKEIRILLLLWFSGQLLTAQQVPDAKRFLQELRVCEEAGSLRNDTALEKRNVFMSYSVKATSWEDEVTSSSVKVYKLGANMHFFSEQANIYMDENEVAIVIPAQRLLILNSTTKDLNNSRLSDEFFEMRRAFLDSCEVLSCETDKGIRTLVLKVDRRKVDPSVRITRMVYQYSVEEKRVKNVRISYDEDYKLKQLFIAYGEFDAASAHKYAPARSYVMDRKGRVNSRFEGYQLVDNRDPKDSKGK